ncbi:hypothetical protein VB715_07465 [Crocosphaera sp. UHCC 0190]|uniref:hypothetical protein n=1 Tax=Crocosphaera sp. UHCC 0190 TaxID=3110246 RepID=UPI002B2147C9|nr:hypothetical protein [Crocosphaera sp. UHCC 0190]MEA5509598.1 hypothetical protein [Crocosphaera sp. UHCC 0190]
MMFNLDQLFGAADFVSDVAGIKERKARLIKFFEYIENPEAKEEAILLLNLSSHDEVY